MFDQAIRFLLTLCVIAIPLFFLYKRRGTAALTSLLACSVALLSTRLPDISSFKLYGLSASLERQTEQAAVTIQQLQNISIALAKTSFENIMLSGQLMLVPTIQDKFIQHKEIVDSLEKEGLSSSDVEKADLVWRSFYSDTLIALMDIEAKKIRPDETAPAPVALIDGSFVSMKKRLQDWVESNKFDSKTMQELLSAYEQVIETGNMKDPGLIPPGAGMRSSTLLLGLPTSPVGLLSGTPWNNGGVMSLAQ